MPVITTSTFLDGGVARTAGENWVISDGANLTVRTDTRWHANAPASMTGTLANITVNLPGGGGYVIDGTKVRWMAFDTGSGNVPAIGTTITQGGVSGYLLGVWTSLTSAPTAVGAAMPATGFLKFREVTGGAYSAGALTGIGANASSPDVTGWIEVVHDSGSSYTFNAMDMGTGLSWVGDWFYLSDTTGTPGQIFQVPTNGGGVGSDISAIQVETAPGSGEFEWWPCTTTAKWTTTAYTTDARAKICQFISAGQVRMGSNGTSNIGFTQVSGCRVRIPNVLIRNAATGTRATNALSSTSLNSRIRFSNGLAKINMSKVFFDGYSQIKGVSSVTLSDSAFEGFFQFNDPWCIPTISRCVVGFCTETNNGSLFSLSSVLNGLVIDDLTLLQQNAGSQTFSVSTAALNITANKLKLLCGGPRAGGVGVTSSGVCRNWNFSNIYCWGGYFGPIGVVNLTVTNFDYIERLDGPTGTTLANTYMINFQNCSNVVVDGVTWGNNQAFSNCHPFVSGNVGLVNMTGSTNMKIRNVGTISTPLSVGASSTTWPHKLITVSGTSGSASDQIKIQRFFVGGTRTNSAIQISDTASQNILIEQIGTGSTATISYSGFDVVVKGIRANANFSSAGSACYGNFFLDGFTSDTVGKIAFSSAQISEKTAPYCSYSVTAGSSSTWTTSGLLLRTVGDFFQYETPYFTCGHTAFANSAFTFNGTNEANHSLQYQLDTGSGWGGVWKTISAANLSAEVISPTTGFKIKFKITCTVASTSNAFTWLSIPTISTLAAQSVYLYPLDTSNFTLTGLIAGSEVRVYAGTNPATATEIGGTESSGTTFSFSHSSGGSAGTIVILAMGYQPVYLPYTFKSTDDSILIQPVVDRNYVNPA